MPRPQRHSTGNADADDDNARRRQLAVVPHTAGSYPFRLPYGWGVEERPRRNGSKTVDKGKHLQYYYEPGTGYKFRSLRAVERHLKGEEQAPSSRALILPDKVNNSSIRRMIVSGGKMMKLNDGEMNQSNWATVASKSAVNLPSSLPDGWIVEKVPRKSGDHFDKYYYEPGTGRKFRSRLAVERYLSELEDERPLSETVEEVNDNKPLAKVFKLGHHGKNSSPSRKKNIPSSEVPSSSFAVSMEIVPSPSFISPPRKINWVLASPQGDAWHPYIGDILISETVKQQWMQRFMLAINEEDCDEPTRGN